jgi:SAM-dependent methyltransferase
VKIDTSGFTDKDSKRPEYRSLYEQTDDYLEAYSKHTDLRIQNDGPALAIGGQWEEHGPLQLAFLKSRGLKPESTLLDFGCGTGRFARHAVPYLNDGNYTGIDISQGAIGHCLELAEKEGWHEKAPLFLLGDGTFKVVAAERTQFDFIWMHSVFTHLPPEIIQGLLQELSQMRFGEFCFTYKRRDSAVRTGLKQFGYPPQWFIKEANTVGLKAEELPNKWPQGQSCMKITK